MYINYIQTKQQQKKIYITGEEKSRASFGHFLLIYFSCTFFCLYLNSYIFFVLRFTTSWKRDLWKISEHMTPNFSTLRFNVFVFSRSSDWQSFSFLLDTFQLWQRKKFQKLLNVKRFCWNLKNRYKLFGYSSNSKMIY